MSTPLLNPVAGRNVLSTAIWGGLSTPVSSGTGVAIIWTAMGDISTASGIGSYDGLIMSPKAMGLDATPTDGLITTNVTTRIDTNFRVSEIMPAYGPGVLQKVAQNFDYIKVVQQYNTVTSGAVGSGNGGFRAAIGRIATGDGGITEWQRKNIYTIVADSAGQYAYEGTTLPAAFTS